MIQEANEVFRAISFLCQLRLQTIQSQIQDSGHNQTCEHHQTKNDQDPSFLFDLLEFLFGLRRESFGLDLRETSGFLVAYPRNQKLTDDLVEIDLVTWLTPDHPAFNQGIQSSRDLIFRKVLLFK